MPKPTHNMRFAFLAARAAYLREQVEEGATIMGAIDAINFQDDEHANLVLAGTTAAKRRRD
jgi:hypothetical protein